MAENVLAEMLAGIDQRKQIEENERLKKQGHKFITVRYTGPVIFEADGKASNVRMHGLRGIVLIQGVDENNQPVFVPKEDAVMLDVRRGLGGEAIADILDDDEGINRQWIARHLVKADPYNNKIEVIDPVLDKEISALNDMKPCPVCKGSRKYRGEDCYKCHGKGVIMKHPFKVELGERDKLLREKMRIEKKLAELPIEPPEDELEELSEDDGEFEEVVSQPKVAVQKQPERDNSLKEIKDESESSKSIIHKRRKKGEIKPIKEAGTDGND